MRWLAVALLSALASPARAEEPLVLAAEDEAAPWSNRDGTGFANDLVVSAFRAAGVEARLEVVPYSRCKHLAVTGKVAACFSMSWVPELEGKVVFPEAPLFRCRAEYWEATARPLGPVGLGGLPRGTLVASVLDYEYPPSFDEARRRGLLAADPSPSEEVALRKLVLGRTRLAVIMADPASKPAAGVAERAGVAGQVRLAFVEGENLSFIGFSAAHPRGAWARARFQEGFRAIQRDGTAARIAAAWRARAGRAPAPVERR
jgi:hypothetical protein